MFNYALQSFKAYCAIWVRRSNFCYQASPRVSPRESTQRRKVKLWARNVREFCLNSDLHVTFIDLLRAAKLYFSSERRRAEDFFALKIRRLRPGTNPRTWVPKTSTPSLDHRSHSCWGNEINLRWNFGCTVGSSIPSSSKGYTHSDTRLFFAVWPATPLPRQFHSMTGKTKNLFAMKPTSTSLRRSLLITKWRFQARLHSCGGPITAVRRASAGKKLFKYRRIKTYEFCSLNWGSKHLWLGSGF
jgi:hypothetical protein